MGDLRVVLIGGPPGAGKTTLCRALGARLGFLATTVDDLVSSAVAFTSPESHRALHPMAGIGHVDYFTNGPPERLVADAVALSETMWPALERIIRRHVTDKDPIVMDWWLFDPDRVAALDSAAVASLWLHIDPDVLDAREHSLTEFREGSRDPERMHANFMRRSLWRNDLIRERATALGLPLLHQPGDASTEELVDQALALIGFATT